MKTSNQDHHSNIFSKHAIKNICIGIAIILLFLFGNKLFAQVGINTSTPNASAALDVESTTSGILIPRMTESQKNLIASPATGLLIYQTNGTNPGFHFYNGTTWDYLAANGTQNIDDLFDGKSDNDGSEDGSSVFLGINAGNNDDSTDNKNIGIGFSALNAMETGVENTAIGYRSMELNTGANENTALGYRALRGGNTSGSSGNVAVGHLAMGEGFTSAPSSQAESNVAVGASALLRNSRGDFNVAIGRNALAQNQTTSRNVAVGYGALSSYRASQGQNTAIGYNAMTNYTSNERAVAIGSESMENATGCEGCTAVGRLTLRDNTSGIFNLALGERALEDNQSGDFNIGLGAHALNTNISGSNNIAIGSFAGAYETGSNKLIIDNYNSFVEANAGASRPLIYGEFDNNIVRVNGEFQVGNPNTTGFSFPTNDGASGQVLTTDGNNVVTWETPTNGDITNVTAGSGLIGGGTSGAVTLNVIGLNGLTANANNIQLGGTLNQDTTINYGIYDTRFNLNSVGDFIIQDGGNEIFVAQDDGNVGIGTGAPDRDLTVVHGTNGPTNGFKLQNANGTNRFFKFFVSQSTSNPRLLLYSDVSSEATSIGNFNATTGIYTATSDRRLKKDFKSLYFDWNNFMSLETLTYRYKKDASDKQYIGLVAQDVEKIYPELINYVAEDDIYHMDYSATGVIAIKAVQELKQEVNYLKAKNEQLKAKLSQLEALEARMLLLESQLVNRSVTNTSEIISNN
ncbi:tail fiber domain-containing protein [Winogradskyella luteola]|uniref:Tail fiber domain-containing protein n=1 Tax=Winogradskyella luteola TaxID=2828330 RepID=A0A9X1JRA9_9FLAO|nr:tail fiber domain-containing protein [Winogradskyella luteola]MBV7269723.1 tail fiber domain-containing protein [Winogradskyella luteola]